MFEDTIKKLRELNGQKATVRIALDEEGYIDRACPADECGTQFKILMEDWKAKISEDKLFCPSCRHEARATSWNTEQQRAYFRATGETFVQNELNEAIASDARRQNARFSDSSFIRITISPRSTPVQLPVPIDASAVMTQKAICPDCRCRYASIGSVFFCPACGRNSILESFESAISTVDRTVALLGTISTALEQEQDENFATDACRQIVENGLVKVVASFQKYAEARFLALPNAGSHKVRRNLFQNLAESDQIWRDATGSGYTEHVQADEYASLQRLFQQRHILSHQDGIVDQRYLDLVPNTSYVLGQKLVVKSDDVMLLSQLVRKLGSRLC